MNKNIVRKSLCKSLLYLYFEIFFILQQESEIIFKKLIVISNNFILKGFRFLIMFKKTFSVTCYI